MLFTDDLIYWCTEKKSEKSVHEVFTLKNEILKILGFKAFKVGFKSPMPHF